MTQNTTVALYQGVEVQQAAYMAAFSQPDGMAGIIEQICAQAQTQAAGIGIDMDKAADRKKLASLAYTVAKAKTAIDNTGKDLVSEAKAKIKIVDDNRKAMRDQLGALQERIRQPVTDWEAEEAAKQAEIDRLLAQIDAIGQASENGQLIGAERLKHRREELLAPYLEHEDSQIRAKAAEADTRLLEHIAAAEQRETQQAEIARLKAEQEAREQAERDARIAAAAAERAKAEAEAKARAEQEAAQRAKWEAEQRAAAAEREKQAALERIEREKAAAAEAERQRIEAEREAKAAAEAARAADIEHRRTINREVYAVMLDCGITEEAAQAFLLRLQNGNVPHLKILY